MKPIIKEVNYDDLDFKILCKKLDEFQNNIFPRRVNLGFSSLKGLDKFQKVLLIYDDNKAIASAALKPVNETTAEVARIYTDEEYRRKGLAQLLIAKITEIAKEIGYKKLILDAWKKSIAARRLYEKIGFVEMPMFDIETLKISFAIDDEDKLKEIQEMLVTMEKNI